MMTITTSKQHLPITRTMVGYFSNDNRLKSSDIEITETITDHVIDDHGTEKKCRKIRMENFYFDETWCELSIVDTLDSNKNLVEITFGHSTKFYMEVERSADPLENEVKITFRGDAERAALAYYLSKISDMLQHGIR